jgi:hypothetical protein
LKSLGRTGALVGRQDSGKEKTLRKAERRLKEGAGGIGQSSYEAGTER